MEEASEPGFNRSQSRATTKDLSGDDAWDPTDTSATAGVVEGEVAAGTNGAGLDTMDVPPPEPAQNMKKSEVTVATPSKLRSFIQRAKGAWYRTPETSASPQSPSHLEALRQRRERDVTVSLPYWRQTIIPQWEQRRGDRKTRDLILQGIPSSVRGETWRLAVGNPLSISKELFDILLGHAKTKTSDVVALQAKELYSDQPAAPDANGDDAAGGARPVQHGSRVVLRASSTVQLKGRASSTAQLKGRVLGRENTVVLITLDVERTFPALSVFQQGGPFYEPLVDMLQAYVIYRPDIGYVQGMSFLASMFFLNMDTYAAFVCMANILRGDLHSNFFRLEPSLIRPYMNVFDELFREHLLSVHTKFAEMGIAPETYLVEWFLTIYSKSLPLDVASRVWDNFLYIGDSFLFRTAVAILRLYESKLLAASFEETMVFVTHLVEGIDEDALFHNIGQVTLSPQRYQALCSKYGITRT